MKKIKIVLIISAIIFEILAIVVLQMCMATNVSPVLGITLLIVGLLLLIIGIVLKPGSKQN